VPAEHEKDPGNDSPRPPDLLSEAYEKRTGQLYEARSTIAEAVAVLNAELSERRREAREQSSVLKEENAELRQALETARQGQESLQAELESALSVLASLQQMKVVRWSAPVRRWVYQFRALRR
jgi:uncharacterized protein YhaN